MSFCLISQNLKGVCRKYPLMLIMLFDAFFRLKILQKHSFDWRGHMRHRTLFFFIILVFFFIKKSTSKLYEVSYDGYNCATSNFHISLQKVLNFTFVILLHIMQHCLWSRQMCIQMKHNYHLHLKHRTKTKILKHKKLFIGKLQL